MKAADRRAWFDYVVAGEATVERVFRV